MSKVNVVLDFDGVINTFAPMTQDDNTIFFKLDKKTKVRVFGGMQTNFRIKWSSELMGYMKEHLFENPDVNVYWLTSWQRHIRTHIDPLFRLLPHTSQIIQWDENELLGKMKALSAFSREEGKNVPMVWVDDEVDSFIRKDAMVPGSSLIADLPENRLIINSHEDYGITRPQWSKILHFVQNN